MENSGKVLLRSVSFASAFQNLSTIKLNKYLSDVPLWQSSCIIKLLQPVHAIWRGGRQSACHLSPSLQREDGGTSAHFTWQILIASPRSLLIRFAHWYILLLPIHARFPCIPDNESVCCLLFYCRGDFIQLISVFIIAVGINPNPNNYFTIRTRRITFFFCFSTTQLLLLDTRN